MSSTLAINGGLKIRNTPMPPRFALGDSEEKEILAVIKYYRERGEDPKYSGVWEEQFCKEFSEFMGGGFTNAVASGTGSMYIGMKALELPPNSDVIISPVTDSGPLSCITEQGHTPVLCDSSRNSYNTNAEEISKRITKKTKLLFLIHAAGEPLDMPPIMELAKSHNIYVLEDCSQAVGAKSGDQIVGSYGHVSGFSTMYRKNLAAGASSGLFFTKDEELFHKALAYGDRGKILWEKGLDFRDPQYSLFPALNWNTDEFSCALGLASLRRLEDTNKRRNDFLAKLVRKLREESSVCDPYNFTDKFAPFYFPVFVNLEKVKCTKLEFAKAVAAEGIGLGEHYGCLISTWPWAQKYLSDDFRSTNAIDTRDRCFHLYLNENYGDQEVDDILEAILKVENYYKI
jgi:perosamine synthetase